MAVRQSEEINFAGLQPTYHPADAGGDEFQNDGKTVLHIRNSSGSQKVCTADSKEPSNFGYDQDEACAVNGGTDRFMGPFRKRRFNNNAGRVEISWNDVTDVEFAVIRLGDTP